MRRAFLILIFTANSTCYLFNVNHSESQKKIIDKMNVGHNEANKIVDKITNLINLLHNDDRCKALPLEEFGNDINCTDIYYEHSKRTKDEDIKPIYVKEHKEVEYNENRYTVSKDENENPTSTDEHRHTSNPNGDNNINLTNTDENRDNAVIETNKNPKHEEHSNAINVEEIYPTNTLEYMDTKKGSLVHIDAGTTVVVDEHGIPIASHEIKDPTIVSEDKPKSELKQSELNGRNGAWQPSWSWLCVEGRCVRTPLPPRPALGAQAWLTCVMLCEPSPLWPEPTIRQVFTSTIVPIRDPPYALNITDSPSPAVTDYLHQAFQLFNRDVRKLMTETANISTGRDLVVKIKVTSDPDPRLRLDTSEEYKLLVYESNGTSVASVAAISFCGARHALETLAQLLWFDEYVGGVVSYSSAYVEDRPRFPYRGLMLDTARNYFPVEDLLLTLDAMAANKLNTFHWHATDSQSFPLKLDSTPQFAWYGAYSGREVYTAEDIKAVVHRARLRGIRVVIEVDGPAHVGRGWGWAGAAGLRPLATHVEASPWQWFCGQPPCGQLDPRNPLVYRLLELIFSEILQLTGVRDVFHLGGDEVSGVAWNGSNVDDLWMLYVDEATLALKRANGGQMPEATILWSSGFTRDYSQRKMLQEFVIQLWDQDWRDEEVEGVIYSNVGHWYLDCGFGGGGGCKYNSEWRVYRHRPWQGGARAGRALGGEACLWSENVGRGALGSRLWTRGAALGERLWADPPRALGLRTLHRLDAQRRRLAARGAGPRPLMSRWCSDNPYECSATSLSDTHLFSSVLKYARLPQHMST